MAITKTSIDLYAVIYKGKLGTRVCFKADGTPAVFANNADAELFAANMRHVIGGGETMSVQPFVSALPL